MAGFDANQLGDDWADTVLVFAGAAPNAADEAVLRNFWKAMAADLKVQLANADVAPGTFIDSVAGAVTGVGGPIT